MAHASGATGRFLRVLKKAFAKPPKPSMPSRARGSLFKDTSGNRYRVRVGALIRYMPKGSDSWKVCKSKAMIERDKLRNATQSPAPEHHSSHGIGQNQFFLEHHVQWQCYSGAIEIAKRFFFLGPRGLCRRRNSNEVVHFLQNFVWPIAFRRNC